MNESWDVDFCLPNPDQNNPGFTNRSLIGICSFPGPCDNLIRTEGQWWNIARFILTASADTAEGLSCDIFKEGYHPDNGRLTLVDYSQGELDPSTYEIEFACMHLPLYFYYVMGDYNGGGTFNVADIVDALLDLKGRGGHSAFYCYCPCYEEPLWSIPMDLNGSCGFNLADVIIGYWHLKGRPFELIPCEYCPPE